MTIFSGPGTLSGTTGVNSVNGVATISNLTVGVASPPNNELLATDGAKTAQSAAGGFTAAAAGAQRLVVLVSPAPTGNASGANFTVTVGLVDQNGNATSPPANEPISLTMGQNPTSSTLNGTTTGQILTTGTQTSFSVNINAPITNTFTIIASSASFGSVATPPFAIDTAGAAAKLVFTSQPGPSVAAAEGPGRIRTTSAASSPSRTRPATRSPGRTPR
jgi:hypothetical protein